MEVFLVYLGSFVSCG